MDVQLERIQAYAKVLNLEIVQAISDDGVSGGIRLDARPGGAQLLHAAGRAARHIVAIKLDRLFRNAEDALICTRRWDETGVALHIIDMGGSNLNTASAMGRAFLTISAAFAELERNLTAERTTSALNHKKRHRKAYSPTPFGYDRSGKVLHRKSQMPVDLRTNETEQQVLMLMRDMRGRHMTYRAIAEELNRRGVATKRGGKSWYASTVQAILDNDIHLSGD